ncbi:MAG: FtsQ-type POTRA domain-containing protein [Syntrophobacterales bacterium]|jgi:cell division protein FtsQ|nr:FtsQ-type POTRA domain-containing protein [Syntrophobacterales bacterium]
MKKILSMLFLIPVCALSVLTLIYLFSKDEPIFFLKNVRISGVQQLGEADIMNKISPLLRESLLKIDAAKMKEMIASHPFVKKVSVKRMYPFSILIDVKEKKPCALWVDGGGNIHVLDEDGEPYRGLIKGDGKGLFIINARDKGDVKSVYREVSSWIKGGLLKKESLSEIYYNEGSITLFGLESGVEIILGKEDQDKRLKRAVTVFEDAKKRGLLIKCIDARFEKGAIIQERKG